jgi:hypothetical protein
MRTDHEFFEDKDLQKGDIHPFGSIIATFAWRG